jgi:cleavage and polyadenylation specificity factor subunit 2
MYCYFESLSMFALIRILQFEDNEVGYVAGRVVVHATSTIPTLEPISSSSFLGPEERVETLKQRTLGIRPAVPLPRSTMIGELKLTALKARLASIGVQAELIGEGVLICGAGAKRNSTAETLEESVAVRKTARGKVELEGNVSEVYYTVRREIYNLHALVAA